MPKRRPLRDKLYERIVKQPNDGCWLWSGKLNRAGFGGIGHEGKKYLVHRVSAQLHGLSPEHWQIVSHTCGVHHCVRPEHLKVGTRGENWAVPQNVKVRVKKPDGTYNYKEVTQAHAAQIKRNEARLQRQRAKAPRCRICSTRMLGAKKVKTTCSLACRRKYYRVTRPNYFQPKPQLECRRKGCKNLVPRVKHAKQPGYCCKECRWPGLLRNLKAARSKIAAKQPRYVIESCEICCNWFAQLKKTPTYTCSKACGIALVVRARCLGTKPLTKQYYRKTPLMGRCEMCAALFLQPQHLKLTCSKKCAIDLRAMKARCRPRH